MAETILKDKYVLTQKLKQDRIGWLWSAYLRETREVVSAREYHAQFCHRSIVEKLNDAGLKTAGLKHPNIAGILDMVYTADGRFFIIYDTPYHGSLTEVLQRIKKFPLYDSQKIIQDIARAVEYAHESRNHLLHGALNPENIDVLASGEIKVRNFHLDHLLNSFLLSKGQNLLNASYLAPEQIRGEKISKATDILALGALFYLLLTGRPPYPVITSLPQILKNYLRPPEKLTILRPDLPLYIEDIIGKALQHRAQHRQQSITEFLGDLKLQKVTLPVKVLQEREAAGQLKPPDSSANPPDNAKINTPPDNWQHRPAKEREKPVTAPPPKPREENPAPFKRALLSRENRRQLIYLALLGVFTACLLLFINAVFFSYFNSVPQIEVPGVLHMPVDDAIAVLKGQGLRVKFSGYINNEELTPNYVAALNPEPGRVVKKDRIIRIYASQQSEGLSAPNLAEHTLQSAEPIVADRGLTINIVERVFSNRYPRQQIISQSPPAGEAVKRGEKINVTVSNGYPVWLAVKNKTETQITVTLFIQNEPDWEPQNAVIYLQDRKGRRKYAEKLLQPGDRDRMEITTDLNGVIEVYYFNDLAFKAELKDLDEA
ncbi:MAG: PASTA domain-containing protein [Candidatus Margulisbacteria bacterium]|jgi:serine/threonine-protein kinase|nr:PASTA domain-containing protein [Candidatus Margulisiibacteriota bacterium]